jgi:hypothetical protein
MAPGVGTEGKLRFQDRLETFQFPVWVKVGIKSGPMKRSRKATQDVCSVARNFMSRRCGDHSRNCSIQVCVEGHHCADSYKSCTVFCAALHFDSHYVIGPISYTWVRLKGKRVNILSRINVHMIQRHWATVLDPEAYRDAWQVGAEWAECNSCNRATETPIRTKDPTKRTSLNP